MTSIQLINVIIHIKALQSPLNHVNVKSSAYIDPRKEINDRDTKFKIGHIVRISKYKSIFVKDSLLFQIGLERFLLLKNLKVMFRGHVLLAILKMKKLVESLRNRIVKNKSKRFQS